MKLDKTHFIQQSNLIDPQFDLYDNLIPGQNPGEKMFDNQMSALRVVEHFVESYHNDQILPDNFVLDIHAALTKNIDVFERYNGLGKWRTHGVKIGGSSAPSPWVVSQLMKYWEKYFYESLEFALNDPTSVKDCSNNVHDLFECIHPFMDGNGRTGRLIKVLFEEICGVIPTIIEYREVQRYYEGIRTFKAKYFAQLYNEALDMKNENKRNPRS